jgi:prepilin-type N-terminal cleavage/methylation domain-containing protein
MGTARDCNRDGFGVVAGFTLVEIMIVVAIIGLLAAFAIPSFVKARGVAQLNSIYNNLRVIESAKDQWALENKHGAGDTITWLADDTGIAPYLKGGTVTPLVSETYVLNVIGSNATATANVNLGTFNAGIPISAQ